MGESDEKAELDASQDYNSYVQQDQHDKSGTGSSASSITAFDPKTSLDRDRAYHSDLDDDYNKDFSSSTPFLAGDDNRMDEEAVAPAPKPAAPGHVTWMSLPHKGQLLILFLCRMVDFLQVATLQAYIFYQLKHMAQRQLLDADASGMFWLHVSETT